MKDDDLFVFVIFGIVILMFVIAFVQFNLTIVR
jgi:hypothetical protein